MLQEVDTQVTDTKIIDALRRELETALTRLEELRSRPLSAQMVDEVGAIQFYGMRLGRRLRGLTEDGLLSLAARTKQSPDRLLRLAMAEIKDECLSRSIATLVEIDQEIGAEWLDGEQVLEALRCLLDIAIARVRSDGRIVARARQTDSSVEFRVGHSGESGLDGVDGMLVTRLVEAAGGEIRIVSKKSWSDVRLIFPRRPLPVAPSKRVWVFPAPQAA